MDNMEIKFITPKELIDHTKNNDKLYIIDVREKEDFDCCHIDGAKNIPGELFDTIEYDTDKMVCILRRYMYAGYSIVLYCDRGNISMLCAKVLCEHGIDTFSLYGGLNEYDMIKYKNNE